MYTGQRQGGEEVWGGGVEWVMGKRGRSRMIWGYGGAFCICSYNVYYIMLYIQCKSQHIFMHLVCSTSQQPINK